VSGIGEKLAENIVNYRSENGPFENRKQLKKCLAWAKHISKVPLLSEFRMLNPLDNSAVHPEAYAIVEKMAKDLSNCE
jgi:uncharacterized protein